MICLKLHWIYPGGGFVDCGAFDGKTVERFINWSGGKYSKIFSFEPDPDNFKILEKFVREKNFRDVKIFNCGAWNEKTQLSFSAQNDQGASFSESGNIKIAVDTIDNIVGNENISLIKMDIEGSELHALQGAIKTIKNNKPVLDICAYHRTEDLITLPQYIKSIHSDYKIYLRKHSFSSEFNLVIYAIPWMII